MAPNQPPTASFDQIIQAGRQKKKSQHLAQEILGRGRTGDGLYTAIQPNMGRGSLASRITKPGSRSASASGIRPNLQHTLKRTQSTTQIERGVRPRALLRQAMSQDPQLRGFSIKGKAGPYVVVGSNFAPGTTNADIQAAMEPVGGQMESCMIISASPTVISEMVFEEKSGADAVIARFNNQMADGRVLHLYHKSGPPTAEPLPSAAGSNARPNKLMASLGDQPRAQRVWDSRNDQERDARRADPEVQDGRYGFASNEPSADMEMDGDAPRRDDRRGYQSSGRGASGSDGRHASGRGSYQGGGRGARDDARSYDYRAHRPDRGLYSDSFSGPNRDRNNRG